MGDALAGVGEGFEGFEEEDEGDDARSMEFGAYDEDSDFENESEDVLEDDSENDSEEDETYIPGRFHQNSMFDRIRSLQGDLADEGIGSSDREEAAVIAARKRRKVREQRAKEIEILHVLNNSRDCSLTRLGSKTGMTPEALRRDYELYLMNQDLMEISTAGRNITKVGKDYLKQLDKAA